MKKTIIAILFLSLLAGFCACKKNAPEETTTVTPITEEATSAATRETTNEIFTAAAEEPTSFSAIPYLKANEVTVNGVTGATTRAQLIKLLGQPDSSESDEDYEIEFYNYGDIRYVFEYGSDTVTSINIRSTTNQTPRNIQVGDKFDDVLNKFPQEKDYRTSDDGAFYGSVENLAPNFGYVTEEGDYGSPSIILATESSVPFFKVHFKDGLVEWMQVFC